MDDWDYEPSDDNKPTMLEEIEYVTIFLAKVLGTILIAALVIGGIVYGVWREIAIFNVLSGGA